jgi:protein MpaA
MPRRPSKNADLGVVIAWSLNGAAALVLVGIGIAYVARGAAGAAPQRFIYVGSTPRPTNTTPPTAYYLPTVTPNPLATPIEDYATPTPFEFGDGPAPAVIGYSVLGRPIQAFTFGRGERQYLIVAGIHGGYEGNTVDLANQMVVHLSENPEVVPGDAALFIIPDMNPDAVARGRNMDARVNANGVDLNRNFPTRNWVPDWNHNLCWNYRPTTGGVAGGSEPETRTVMNYIGAHRIVAMISYHSAALGVFPGGTPWTEASSALAMDLADATGYPFPPIDIGCNYTGTLADWAVEHGVGAAVDMELSNHRDAELSKNLRALDTLLGFAQ